MSVCLLWVLMFIGYACGRAAGRADVRRMGLKREYTVQLRMKGTEDEWRSVSYSIGSHNRAYNWLKTLQRDFPNYDFRIATRMIGKWVTR